MSTTGDMLAQRLRDLAGDLRALMPEHLPPEIEAELAAIERALERAAARAENPEPEACAVVARACNYN